MKLRNLINNLKTIKYDKNLLEKNIKKIKIRSKDVEKGDLFIALKGKNFNGNDFIFEAIDKGASVIVSEENLQIDNFIQVEDAREFYALVCKNLFGCYCDKMRIIAVTGTNGKTTITHLIEQQLSLSGIKTGKIGTLGVEFDDKKFESGMTTPDPYFLHKMFKKMFKSGCKVVVMEASAHAIHLKKLAGITFEIAIISNITEDHLDYFGTMTNYAMSKAELFFGENVKKAIFYDDNKYCRAIKEFVKIPVVTYGIKRGDVRALNLEKSFSSSQFDLEMDGTKVNIKSFLIGEYNVLNIIASIIVCKMVGLCIKQIKDNLLKIGEPEGRFNVIKYGDRNIVVDFAHTPDGLKKVLMTAKGISKNKLVIVFGCGGNRDKKKRPIMGEVASRYADKIILTSDNPRWENPLDIINQIKVGVDKDCIVIENRKDAIRFALKEFCHNETIVIAGKGAEKYQEIKGEKNLYSDFEEINKFIENDTK